MGRIEMVESSGGDDSRVYHLTKAERDNFMRQMEANADVMTFVNATEKLYNDVYDRVAEQYKAVHGKELQRDEFYFHMIRDPAFIKKFAKEAGEDGKMENLFKAYESGQAMLALNPENQKMLKHVNWSDAPLIIRNVFDEVETHIQDSARYLEASPVKNWVDQNILSPDIATALRKTEQGRNILKYWENTSEIAGGLINPRRTAVDQAMGAFMKNATPVRLANPLVWLKQPMSMVAGVAYFGDAKYLAHMHAPRDRAFIKQVLDANGTLAGRRASKHFDPNLPEWRGQGSGARISGVYESKLQMVQAKSAGWVQKAMSSLDSVAIDGIIMAARQYVKDTQPSLKGDEFIKEVGQQAAMAVKMTQVATYGIDRTMMERNIQGAWNRMLVYMWGARGAQFNLLAQSMKSAFAQGTPQAMKNAALIWLTAGLAQSAQVALVDLLRAKGDEPPDDEDVNKAYSFGVNIFENMAGTIPVIGSEFVPGMIAPIYRAIGDKQAAQLRSFRAGKTGPLAGVASDATKIFSTAVSFMQSEKELASKSVKERAKYEREQEQRIRSARRALTRLGSEMFGIPVNQVESMIGRLTPAE